MTLVDCGPGRFAIWRKIASECDGDLCTALRAVFNEFGPPQELLLDNFTTHRGAAIQKLLSEMGIESRFRCANRPSGNGLVERCHRTIKRMAARSKKPIHDMVAWYNATPNSAGVIPASTVFAQRRRLPLPIDFAVRPQNDDKIVETGGIRVGDEVFVKPVNASYTT